jgi:hypothetical protein
MEQLHDTLHFFLGTVPILGGESVYGDIPDTPFSQILQDSLEAFNAHPVPGQPGEAPLPGPPAVTVHDEGHMLRYVGVRLRRLRE